MKKFCYIIALVAVASACLSSCKEKNKTDDIIVDKVVAKPQNGPESMSSSEQNGSVKWIDGNEYAYTITRAASDSLPEVENHGRKYHDNKIKLVVSRPDGTVFFQKVFSKSNFEPMLPAQFKETGVLLGMKLDKAEGNRLNFVVSFGSPDENNEEFFLVKMTLDNFGHTAADKYQAPVEAEE